MLDWVKNPVYKSVEFNFKLKSERDELTSKYLAEFAIFNFSVNSASNMVKVQSKVW